MSMSSASEEVSAVQEAVHEAFDKLHNDGKRSYLLQGYYYTDKENLDQGTVYYDWIRVHPQATIGELVLCLSDQFFDWSEENTKQVKLVFAKEVKVHWKTRTIKQRGVKNQKTWRVLDTSVGEVKKLKISDVYPEDYGTVIEFVPVEQRDGCFGDSARGKLLPLVPLLGSMVCFLWITSVQTASRRIADYVQDLQSRQYGGEGTMPSLNQAEKCFLKAVTYDPCQCCFPDAQHFAVVLYVVSVILVVTVGMWQLIKTKHCDPEAKRKALESARENTGLEIQLPEEVTERYRGNIARWEAEKADLEEHTGSSSEEELSD